MKKLFVILFIALLGLPIFAQEETKDNEQLIDVENAGGLLLFQKQPAYEKQCQVIRIKKSGGITIIQINGKSPKVKENKEND